MRPAKGARSKRIVKRGAAARFVLTHAALCEHQQTNTSLPDGNQAVGALSNGKHANIRLHLSHVEARALQGLDVTSAVVYHIPI
jgi:hypothetical protein